MYCVYQNGRLKSGDRILQIGDIDVRDRNTEGVATVLRQLGVHVRLIVARNIDAIPPSDNNTDLSIVTRPEHLNEAFRQLNASLHSAVGVDIISPVESTPEIETKAVRSMREIVRSMFFHCCYCHRCSPSARDLNPLYWC